VNAKDNDGDTPLDWAIDYGETETADLLRKHGGKHGTIHIAILGGDAEGVKEFLAGGADVNAKNQRGWTPLFTAAYYGHKEIVELLISKGADVNAKTDKGGSTPLHTADNKEIAELLIAEGADVNAKNDGGKTPLDYAETDNFEPPELKAAKKEIADLLRKHGGKTGAEFSIHVAAAVGNIEAVKQHLADGADVNAKNYIGWTPLHEAAWEGHKEIAEQLIAAGADVNAKTAKTNNGSRSTPLDLTTVGSEFDDYGERAVKRETADLLREHGGKTAEELWALMPRLVQHGRFAFSFDAKEGKVYEVQDSFDLLNWEVIKTYTGTGDSVRFDEERDHDPPKIFYRVKVVE